MGSRKERLELIRKIQEHRGSKVLVYFTGDRRPFSSQIAEDAVLPLYKHLLALKETQPKRERIDLFLYTRGGDVSVPWRIVTMIREFYGDFSVLIPYKAHSAGTMIALGADKIVMSKKAELSPIDPTLVRAVIGESTVPPPEISVEDVTSYISFMRERANITDQSALAQVVSQLASHLTPLTLGSVNRQYSHIRLVARKLLTSRKEKIEEGRVGTIIEALTEKMYSHGHAIGRMEATELGLPVDNPDENLEALIWNLYQEYEHLLQLTEPIDPEELLIRENKEEYAIDDIPLAIVETIPKLNMFEINSILRRKRQVPPNPQINVNVNLGLPPGIDPTKLPQNFQQIVQQLMGQIAQAIPQIVQQELVRQSPIVGIEGRTFGGKWKEKTDENI
ncbi:MAG: ATP-dependent Clp protease proteolytic subunit [Methanophagales archaeon]|nr:ATP-dependent Clp protease proteolytic subunit [Methanophagales archaeon]